MKVIACDDRGDAVVLSATKREVAQLCGYHSEYHHKVHIKCGDVICINSMYDHLYRLSNAGAEIERTRDQLMSIVKSLELPQPVLDTRVPKE